MQTEAARMATRTATEKDLPLVQEYIKKLALYEKRPEDVTATREDLRRELFEKKRAEVLLAALDGETVGYALYYTAFASFSGVSRLYLEDLFIDPAQRGKGLGKELLLRVGKRAKEMGCAGMLWGCLGWNKPSIRFYECLGAKQDASHVSFVLQEHALDALLAQNKLDGESQKCP